MSNSQVKDARDVFNKMDVDKDGFINPDDLKITMNTLGFDFNPSEIQRLVMTLDPENKGKIDFNSFSELIKQKMSEKDHIEEIQMAFQMLDTEKRGKIGFADLKRVANELGENISDYELHEMINEADVDRDNEISFDEFLAIMKEAAPQL